MRFVIFLIFFFVLFFSSLIYAQNDISDAFNKSINNKSEEVRDINSDELAHSEVLNGWSIGLQYGVIKFHGDISEYILYPAYEESIDFHELRSGISLVFKKRLNPVYSLEGRYIVGEMAGIRRDYNTNDTEYFENHYEPYGLYQGNGEKFITDITEMDVIIKTNLNSFSSYLLGYRFPDRFRLELDLGVGYNQYRVIRSNLLSNDFIFSYGYQEWDGVVGGAVESERVPAGVLIYGMSSSYEYNSRLDITLSYNIHRSFTDKWDGSPSISERDNDMYSFFSLGILYRLGEHNYNNEWISPIDQLTDDVSILSINIDGLTEDTDNDGISDAFDKSENTPFGVPVDGSGVPLDVDMDNVPDYRDADPFSFRGAVVDENGVELDDDKDGVPNSKDLESNTMPGVMVNQFGITASQVSANSHFPSIYFQSGSSAITLSNKDRLATVAIVLKKNSNIRMKVIGYADNIGNPQSNKKLAFKRANAVIEYLDKNYNISSDRFSAAIINDIEKLSLENDGLNKLADQEDTSTDLILEINRRVDFEILYY